MSTAEPAARTATAAGPERGPGSAGPGPAAPQWTGRRGRSALRLLRSELGLVLRRRRNQALLAVLAGVPILIGVAVWLSSPQGNDEGGPNFIARITENGVFLGFAAVLM